MFTVSLIGQKGGTGKTTAAIGLAVAAFRAGQVVAIIDLDPQATATNWKDRREADNPAVVSAQASRLRQTLDVARDGGAEFVIIDTAGRNDDSALNAARLSDLVLIPTRANIVELETLRAVADLLKLAGNPPAFVVLNGIHPTATKQAEEARETVQQLFGLVCAPAYLCHRAAYAEAPTTGKAPQELDPEGKAGLELDRLFRFTYEFLNNGTCEHGKGIDSGSATSAA
jgi:chromosome partitioning protein